MQRGRWGPQGGDFGRRQKRGALVAAAEARGAEAGVVADALRNGKHLNRKHETVGSARRIWRLGERWRQARLARISPAEPARGSAPG